MGLGAGMSMMHCAECQRLVDTDEPDGLVWQNVKPFRMWCETCSQDTDNPEMLKALEAQDPEIYAELMDFEVNIASPWEEKHK